MIVEYVRYETRDADAFMAAYGEARTSLDASPNCLAYELARCTEDPSSFVLRIEWDSLEGHLKGFRGGPQFPGFLAAIRPYISEIKEMRHYELTSVVARKG
jgi:quinol monooxygenase YgiN